MAQRRDNPFEQSSNHENFPPFDHLFESSPSIDTIARTKPVEFSLGERSSARSHAGRQESPWDSAAAPRSGLRSNLSSRQSPRQPRKGVAKQLTFGAPPEGASGTWREGSVSRKMAKAAGWPTPGHPSSAAQKLVFSDDGDEAGDPHAASTTAPVELQVGDVAMPNADDEPDEVEVITTAERDGNSVAIQAAEVRRPTLEPAASLPRLPTPASFARPVSAMPRSPSAPALRRSTSTYPQTKDFVRTSVSAAAAELRTTHTPSTAAAAHDPAEDDVRMNETIDEVRRALLQPPSFEFTQYLRGLRHRWPQRPLMRSRLTELGLSPTKLPPWRHHTAPEAMPPTAAHLPIGHPPMSHPLSHAPMSHPHMMPAAAAWPAQPMALMAAPMAPPMGGAWPYYWQAAPIAAPAPYWTPQPAVWPAMPPQAAFPYFAGAPPPIYPTMPTWPVPTVPFSTAALPPSRHAGMKYDQ